MLQDDFIYTYCQFIFKFFFVLIKKKYFQILTGAYILDVPVAYYIKRIRIMFWNNLITSSGKTTITR